MDTMMNGASAAEVTAPLPKVAIQELLVGQVIGKGGFSLVKELRGMQLAEVFDTSEEDAKIRRQFADSCARQDAEHRYVVKLLRNDLPEDEHTKGVVDLAVEAQFLEKLSHSNIIKMRAMANSDPFESKFFIILERLVLTLERRIPFWRKDVGENIGFWMGPCFGYCCAKNHILHRLWMERLMVARDIAKAIRYLHDQGVVYRDLKPDNVGFDAEDRVKIFDFGLAKRLDPEDRTDDDLYMMTGNTGSLRYMAPEVAFCQPYDVRVDSYSFGVLFWQICSLTTPFAGYTTKMHSEKVLRGGYRPKPDATWPLPWVQLMKDCWSSDISARPDFDNIVRVLEEEVTALIREEGLVPSRRASEIRAKKHKRKKMAAGEQRLDVDTRIHTEDETTSKRHDASIV